MPEAPQEPTHEENLAQVAAANAQGALADWSRVGTACPACGLRDVVDVRQVVQVANPGTFSLAGAQVKFPATVAWEYLCSNCGATGPTAPR